MGVINGTSTVVDASSSVLTLAASDLGYVVVLLLVLNGIMLLDFFRRLFIKR